jgi:hypothetical protein
MANSLTFTGTIFVSASQFTSASQFISQEIVTAGPDGSRIYGISAQTTNTGSVQIHLAYSSSTVVTSLYHGVVLPQAGNTASIAAADLFGATVGAAVFQKQKDANGVPYFNIPANTAIIAVVSGSLLQRIHANAFVNITTFGENY